MPADYLCVILSQVAIEERWVVVVSPVVHAAHSPHCRYRKETLTLMVQRATMHSASRLQSIGHLGNADTVSYDAAVKASEGDDLGKLEVRMGRVKRMITHTFSRKGKLT